MEATVSERNSRTPLKPQRSRTLNSPYTDEDGTSVIRRPSTAREFIQRSSLESALRVLVHSNLFISLAATSWVVITAYFADLTLDPIPLFIVFAVTLFVYSLNRITDIEEDRQNVPGRASFTGRFGHALLGFGILAYLLAIALAVAWNLPRVEFMALPLVVALLYSLAGIKRLLLVKNLIVGASWGAIPLGVGVYYGVLESLEIQFLFVYVTAMLTIAAVVFDVKDLEGDREAGIRTVPNTIGVRATRFAAATATVLVAVGVVSAVAVGPLSSSFLVLLAFNLYVCWYSVLASPEYGPLFFGFVVDGEHVFLGLLVLTVTAVG